MKRLGTATELSRKQERPRGPHRELVLYVEDDDDNFNVAALRLQQHYELLRAANAEQTCAVLQKRGGELAAILMDVELRVSDLNGMALTRLIRGRRVEQPLPAYAQNLAALPHTPLIFVTAHGAKYSDVQLLLAGADRVIPKPVDFGALNLALTQLHLERAARLKRAPRP